MKGSDGGSERKDTSGNGPDRAAPRKGPPGGMVNPNLRAGGAFPPPPPGRPPFGAYPPPPPPPPGWPNPGFPPGMGGYPPPGAFPPPPPGYPPPPPGHPGAFPYPPPGYPQQGGVEVEYDENGQPVYVEYEYVEEDGEGDGETSGGESFAPPPGAMPPLPGFPPPAPGAAPNGFPDMDREAQFDGEGKGRDLSHDDERILNRQKEGFERAREIEETETRTRRLAIVMRLFVLVAAIAGASFAFYKYYDEFFPQTSVFDELDEKKLAERLQSAEMWNLASNKANNVVRAYFEAIGGIDAAGRIYDKLMWGTLQTGITVEPFYCIEKNRRAYLKVGPAGSERIYLLNADGGAKLLMTSSVTGPSEALSVTATEDLNGMIFTDEHLHYAAFVDYVSNKDPFKFTGTQIYEDKIYETIEMQAGNGAKIVYYFDPNTHLIAMKTVENSGLLARIEYQDYAVFDGVKLPRVRNIYVDGKLYGTSLLNSARFNRDVIFPR